MRQCGDTLAVAMVMLLALLLASCGGKKVSESAVYSCERFTLYADSVVEGDYSARVVDSLHISSNYSYVDSTLAVDSVQLRFCLNGHDNEMSHGRWHTVYIVPGDTTPALIFGSNAADTLRRSVSAIPQSARRRWTLRLDMRPVIRALHGQGYYATPTGDTIYREHFRGVWAVGRTMLTETDPRRLRAHPELQLLNHGDTTYLVTFGIDKTSPRTYIGGVFGVDSVAHHLPRRVSRLPLADVAYNIAAGRLTEFSHKEMIATDEVLAKVHAVNLSLALVDPELSKELLRSCVDKGRIKLMDSHGTWPFAVDRLMWVVAANELFKCTGDTLWLAEAERVARNTINIDVAALYDGYHRLLHGGYDMRIDALGAYPEWFDIADLYSMMSLRVNVGFSAALQAWSEMCTALNVELPTFDRQALNHRINLELWMPHRGFYSSFLYGNFYPTQSPATDNLGQALAVIYGVANGEMSSALIRRTPTTLYGVADFLPMKSTALRSHTKNIDPSIMAYRAIASSHVGNTAAVDAAVAAFYRNFAFTAGGGYVNVVDGLPAIDSLTLGDKLKGAASTMAMTLRLTAGISVDGAGLHLSPYVTQSMGAYHLIRSLRYRDAVLDIEIQGTGSVIHSMTIDGEAAVNNMIPASLKGHHKVRVMLLGNRLDAGSINIADPEQLPPTPEILRRSELDMCIGGFRKGEELVVDINGVVEEEISDSIFTAPRTSLFSLVDMRYLDKERRPGFRSNPLAIVPRGEQWIIPADTLGLVGTSLAGNSGRGDHYIELTPMRNRNLAVTVNSNRDTEAFIDLRYANGGGSEHLQMRSVLRSLIVNGERAGTLVMPCHGEGDWYNDYYTYPVRVRLQKGANKVEIRCDAPYDLNASSSAGTAIVRHMRLLFIDR